MRYFWAALLILLGALLLAGNFDLLTGFEWGNIWRFWPLVIVLWGLYLIVRKRRNADVIMLVALVLSVLGVGAYALTVDKTENNLPNGICCETDGAVRESKVEAEMPTEVTKSKVTVNTGAVKFNINGGTTKLLEGTFLSNFMEPKLKTSVSNGEVAAVLDSVNYRRRVFFFRDFKNEIDLKLNRTLPVNLEVNTGASELNFDLSDIRLSDLLIKAGATSLELKLGNLVQNDANVNIEAGASSLEVSVPKEVGVRIVSESGLAGQEFNGFTKKSDTVWESEGYESAEKKINLTFRAGASSIKVTRD